MRMDPLTQFQDLITKFLSEDNDARKLAEDAYEEMTLESRATLLLQLAKVSHCPLEVRQMCLVLCRRLLSNNWDDLWTKWTPDNQNAYKLELLASVQQEQNGNLRRKYCDVIAEMARNHLDDELNQTWPEVLKFLFDCVQSPNPAHKETALSIIQSVPGIFGTQQAHYLPVIKQMLSQCLIHESSSEVRCAAVEAASAFLCDNEGDSGVVKTCNDLATPILRVCAENVESGDGNLLTCLVDLAGQVPKFFRHRLNDLCTLCLKVLSNKENEDIVRHSALETVVAMAESAAPMMRKDGHKFLPEIVKQCLTLMVDLEDEEGWAFGDDTEEEDAESNASVGETSMDRLAVALGGKAMLPQCLDLVPVMLRSAAWQDRHAALMAISAIGEGCHKQMEPMLVQVVDLVLPYLKDPHPRVRYAACNALGQMSSDFGPALQKKLHEKVIPALLHTLDDVEHPRVQAHALAGLVNFFEECTKTILAPYLLVIMQKLEIVLNQTFNDLVSRGKKLVLEQVITTIASVADSSQDKFVQFYDFVMPKLKYILQNAVQPELRMLRGKTIECISLIGLAVGTEKFLPDADEIMQLLLRTQTGEALEDDDPQLSYVISAWARVCKLLGKRFEPYLPMVMPQVMKTAALKPEVALLEADEAKQMEEENEWQFVSLGDQSFGIKTAGLEDKATACQMLVCYARELKEGFADYVQPVTELLVPMLKFFFHDGVRVAAAESLPFLLEAASIKGQQFVVQMWQYICPELLKAIEMDPDPDALAEHMYSLSQCIEKLGPGCLTHEQLDELLKLLTKYMNDHFEKQDQRQEKRKDEDYDEEVENELADEDDEDVFLLSKVSDIVHALMKTHKEQMLPLFDHLLPFFVKLVGPHRPYHDRQWGICFFDDLIEYTGATSIKYVDHFLRPMLQGLDDPAPEVRQAAAYGFGVMAMYGGNVYAQTLAEAVPHLAKMIELSDARATDADTSATENGVAAVVKILKFNSSMIDSNQILPHFLRWLPVWEDTEECPYIYGYLCDLLEINHPVILGENNANLPRILCIIADALSHNAFDEEAGAVPKTRLLNLVRQCQGNQELFQACLQQMTQEQVQALSTALQG